MTEIVARACKIVLRKTLQDLHLRKQESGSKRNKTILDVVDFLNCIFGKSLESEAIWKVLEIHSIYYFKTKINK